MSVRKYLPTSAVVALALLSSAVGVINDYTYDDRYVVLLNPLTHSLHRWWAVFAQPYWPRAWTGDGYRPLTILAFSVEWVARNGSPVAFHAANILLYVLASVLVYQLALALLPAWAAWVVGALFAVHPVHVEAVANVVGQSELLVAVAILAATILYVRDRRAGALRPGTAVAVTVLYAMAAFSKEHGIVLPAILIAAECTVIDDATPLRDRARRLRPFYLALLAVAVGFVAARSRVLSDHTIGGFQPFMPFAMLKISARDRILSAITVVPQWVRLLALAGPVVGRLRPARTRDRAGLQYHSASRPAVARGGRGAWRSASAPAACAEFWYCHCLYRPASLEQFDSAGGDHVG